MYALFNCLFHQIFLSLEIAHRMLGWFQCQAASELQLILSISLSLHLCFSLCRDVSLSYNTKLFCCNKFLCNCCESFVIKLYLL